MSPHLIRIWERRYGAVSPRRTDTGRRLYTDEDIERLILLRRATKQGESISQLAGLSQAQLKAVVARSTAALGSAEAARGEAKIERHLNLCLGAMKDLDAIGLETRLLRASSSFDRHTFLDKLLHPLLEMTGEMWADGRLKVAHEHLASAVIRSLLGSMYLSNSMAESAPLLLSASPAGQMHEFGALMASVIAAAGGWRTLYLGPNLPAEDIADAAMRRNAQVIALSIIYPADDPILESELRRLRQLLPDGTRIVTGGRAALGYIDVLNEIGAVSANGLTNFRSVLDKLRNGYPLRRASK
jgi:DNA-binding transcriptional MerR regulator/methylmalonyl-CoA mutase cobalamin-binding subunit